MCGFIGGTEPSWHYQRALNSIAHRGPDASKLCLDGVVNVGFRRLAIIDLRDDANQPMFAADNATWLVFNGEIYGYQTVRKDLEKRGHVFRTTSDTEVVLNSYLQWGDNFVDHIDGMFALAIWDERDRRLKLYRDRAGIKPLYYYHKGMHFAFASELKAIEIACEAEALQVDNTALYDFLGYRYASRRTGGWELASISSAIGARKCATKSRVWSSLSRL